MNPAYDLCKANQAWQPRAEADGKCPALTGYSCMCRAGLANECNSLKLVASADNIFLQLLGGLRGLSK